MQRETHERQQRVVQSSFYMAFVVIPPFFLSAQETDALFVPDRVIEAQVIALRTNKPNFPLNDIVVDLKLNRIETRFRMIAAPS